MSIIAEANTAPTTQSWSAWHIDPRHSLAQFSVRHMMLSKVRGQFTGISGTIVDAADDPKRSSVKALLDQAADESTFREILEQEAITLTDAGNRFQIRHSETSQVPLQRNDHVDYLFHRLFALIWLVLRAR